MGAGQGIAGRGKLPSRLRRIGARPLHPRHAGRGDRADRGAHPPARVELLDLPPRLARHGGRQGHAGHRTDGPARAAIFPRQIRARLTRRTLGRRRDEVDGVEEEQLRRLNRSRALATGMLAVAATIFALSLAFPNPSGWLLLVRSVAEAALVGGLADWFAVTALFRRPLRLPIPHTAIVPANKDRIGEGLARFLDRNFLTGDLLIPELRALRIADRLAAWLADRRNASALAGEIGKALPFVLRAVDDSQIKAFLGRALGAQLRSASLGPLAAQIVRILTAAGYHQAVLDSALDYARDFLGRNEERPLEAVTERRRRWIPRAINREIARAMLRAAGELIDDLRQPDGAARQGLLAAIDELTSELATSDQPTARGGARSGPPGTPWFFRGDRLR